MVGYCAKSLVDPCYQEEAVYLVASILVTAPLYNQMGACSLLVVSGEILCSIGLRTLPFDSRVIKLPCGFPRG